MSNVTPTSTNALHLRKVVEDAIGDDVGTYTFSNKQNVKAIAVIKGSDIYPPPETSVAGLEIVIFYPSPKVEPLLGGYVMEEEWVIHIKQWNSKENTLLATKLLLSKLGNVKNVSRMPASERLGIPETTQIRLRDFSYQEVSQD